MKCKKKLKAGQSPKLKYFPSISVEGMRKSAKKSVRISRFSVEVRFVCLLKTKDYFLLDHHFAQ